MKCFVLKSMTADVQRQCHVDLGEPPMDAGRWWTWEGHKFGRFGNCERCAWRPMHTTMHCKDGWWEEREVFEQMKDVLSSLGRLADERPTNLGSGYVVNRPELMKHCIRCWSPCGCCVTYMTASASVLTQCELPQDREHDFDWAEAEDAIQAFLSAESGDQTLAVIKTDVKVDAQVQEVQETGDGKSLDK